jgi:hypothetical protein
MHSAYNAFYKFSFLEQKSESKKIWILILACDSHFAKANGTHPTGVLIAPTTRFFNFFGSFFR